MNTRIAFTSRAARRLLAKTYEDGLVAVAEHRSSSRSVALGFTMATLFSTIAKAADTDSPLVTGGLDPATMLLNVSNFILGPFGETLGVLGIIGIGMAWMFGRASLGLVAGVIGGIVIMFGAGYLGESLMGTTAAAG